MKKVFIILSVVIIAVSLLIVFVFLPKLFMVWPKPFTAKDFDSELYGHSNMTKMGTIQWNSFDIIGTKAEDFDDIAGWEKISGEEKMLCKQYEMFGYDTAVMLVLDKTGTYIDHVLYDFADVTTEESFDFRYILLEVVRRKGQAYIMKNGNLQEVDIYSEFNPSYEAAVRDQSEIAYSLVWQYTVSPVLYTVNISHSRVNHGQDAEQSVFETTLMFSKQ